MIASKHAVTGTETSVSEARRKRLAAVSDEAIDEVQEMTANLMILRSKS